MNDDLFKRELEKKLNQDQSLNSLTEQQSEVDPRLVEAQKGRDKLHFYGNLLTGFQDLIKGATGYQPSYQTADALKQQGDQLVKDYEDFAQKERQAEIDNRRFQQDDLAIQQKEMKFKDEKELRNPLSSESIFLQKAFGDMLRRKGNQINDEQLQDISAQDILTIAPSLRNLMTDNLALEKLRLSQERLNLLRQKEGRLGDQFSFRKDEKQEISDKQTEQLAGYDEALNLLDDAQQYKKDVNTGFVTNISDKVRSFFGGGDVDVARLKMAIGESLAQKIKSLSGTAVSDQERQFLADISLPSINDDDNVFKTKLKQAIKTLKKAKDNRISAFKKQGKDPSAFEETQKHIIKREYSPSRNATRLTYSDGTTEIIDGR